MTPQRQDAVLGLSLIQPWATLVAEGHKRIETRSWKTPYRGWVAIHASARPKGEKLARYYDVIELLAETLENEKASVMVTMPEPFSAIVALCLLTDVRSTGSNWEPDWLTKIRDTDEFLFGDYSPNRFGWFLKDLRKLPQPIPCRGALGLWDLPADVKNCLFDQLEGKRFQLPELTTTGKRKPKPEVCSFAAALFP